jgi:predicted ATPase
MQCSCPPRSAQPASADALLRILLGDDPRLAPFTRLLIQRTEGNPLFLEESVRTLVETGALVGEPGAYRVAHALPTMQIPATVQAVLAARIDRTGQQGQARTALSTAIQIYRSMDMTFWLLQAEAALAQVT